MNVVSKAWPKIYEGSVKSTTERNDCFVRAITETFDVPYDEAHTICETKFKRLPKRGTKMGYFTFMSLLNSGFTIGEYNIGFIPPDDLKYCGSKNRIGLFDDKSEKFPITVGMFLRTAPIGRYIVLVKGHAFSVVDGVVIGNKNDATRMKIRIENVVIAEPKI